MNSETTQQLRFAGIIPARYASTRFPGKPLVDIGGKPMIQRVYEQVRMVLQDVYVATDDERIAETVATFKGNAIMTSDKHRSGTDRCYEAYLKTGNAYDVIINIQGDEPFIAPSQITTLMECFADENTQIATLVKPISAGDPEGLLFNPNSPKVVLDRNNYAMYFSRSPIPYLRGTDNTQEWTSKHNYLKHIGIYAYRTNVLKEITSLDPSILETAESLEQLRWLENGYKIKVGFTDIETVGIDTPEDLKKVAHLF